MGDTWKYENGQTILDLVYIQPCPVKWFQPVKCNGSYANFGLVTSIAPGGYVIDADNRPSISRTALLLHDEVFQQPLATPDPYRSVYACCGPYCPERPPVTQRKKCYTCGELMSEVKNG